MGLSVNEFTYAGADEFDLNFALGYASRGDVTCYKKGETPVDLDFDWLTSSRVRLTPGHGLVNGDEIVFRRTVSKRALPVNLNVPGNATRENLDLLSRHVMYALHEVLDERADDYPSSVPVLPVSMGGTGANTPEAAAANLGIFPGVNVLAPERNLSDLASAPAARANLLLSDPAVLALATPVTDVHAITQSGTYSAESSATNIPTVSGTYVIEAAMSAAGRGVVIATLVSAAPRQWIKTRTSGGWQAWREVVTELSTLPQSQWDEGTAATESVISPAKLAAFVTPAFGAVRSYAFLGRRSVGTIVPGQTYPASDLVPAGVWLDGGVRWGSNTPSSLYGRTDNSVTVSGTWMALGASAPNDRAPATLFQRIS